MALPPIGRLVLVVRGISGLALASRYPYQRWASRPMVHFGYAFWKPPMARFKNSILTI
jgi:hypothetical protein